MILSKRLQAVADMVKPCSVAADIGCDHAHVSIYLCKSGLAGKVIACDVAKGPLVMAAGNVRDAGMEAKVELRLADGLMGLARGEADTIIIAGMGGRLMTRIIDDGIDRIREGCVMVLSPQSDIPQFRRFLHEKGFVFDGEEMILEDGKFYLIMRVIMKNAKKTHEEIMSDIDYEYGRLLLNSSNKTLLKYLQKEQENLLKILSNIETDNSTDRTNNRAKELEEKLKLNKKALRFLYEMQGNN